MMQIKPELAQAILNYLITRPYQEVFQLVDAIQKLERAVEPKTELKKVK